MRHVERHVQLLAEDLGVEKVLDPKPDAGGLVGVGRPYPPPGRAQAVLAQVALRHPVQLLVVGHDQVGVAADAEAAAVDALRLQGVHLVQEHGRVDHHPVADHGGDVAVEDRDVLVRREQVQDFVSVPRKPLPVGTKVEERPMRDQELEEQRRGGDGTGCEKNPQDRLGGLVTDAGAREIEGQRRHHGKSQLARGAVDGPRCDPAGDDAEHVEHDHHVDKRQASPALPARRDDGREGETWPHEHQAVRHEQHGEDPREEPGLRQARDDQADEHQDQGHGSRCRRHLPKRNQGADAERDESHDGAARRPPAEQGTADERGRSDHRQA